MVDPELGGALVHPDYVVREMLTQRRYFRVLCKPA
jgi:hypothetical protein